MDGEGSEPVAPAWGLDDPEAFARAMYAALDASDFERFIEGVHPDVTFVSLIAESEGIRYHGHDGVRQWARDVAEALGGLRFEPRSMERWSSGFLISLSVEGRPTGMVVTQSMWQAVEIREGLVTWWQTYRTREEALAGIAERDA